MMRKIVMCMLFALMLVACSQATPTPEVETDTSLTGKITFAGSTTVQPLADKLGDAFRKKHSSVTLDIAAGGSVVGIEAVHDGTVDIGMASRALKTEEAEGITAHQIAVDVIAVVVNAENPVEDLTLEQLRDIYLGKITKWSQVGGRDQPVEVVIRGENSGTRGAFDEIVLDKQDPTAPNLQTAVTAGDVAASVAKDPDAIGYVGFGNLEPGLKLVAIDSVVPSEETARDGSYPLVRPLLLLTGPLTQPLAQTFVDFVLSDEGQEIVKTSGWVTAK
jgi:phosphate transport system substrate-binding protein